MRVAIFSKERVSYRQQGDQCEIKIFLNQFSATEAKHYMSIRIVCSSFLCINCRHINPDVEIEVHNMNITTMDNYTVFVDRMWLVPQLLLSFLCLRFWC